MRVISCEVRKPSKKCTNGTRDSSVAICAIAARSWASCTEADASCAKPVAAHGHHVLVVAEDRQRMRGERPRRHMEDRWRQFAGDLVHVRDHQQQALATP